MPLLRTISIDKSSQMNLAVASRFHDIETIRINSLMSIEDEDPDDGINL